MRKLVTLMILAAVMGTMGCTVRRVKTGQTTMDEMEFTDKNHKRMIEARPAPILNDSLERHNLIKYLEYWNNADRLSYIYLLSRSGTVIDHYTIKGKVSYCRSKLTTRDQIIFAKSESGGNVSGQIVESPGLDGSYGPSEDAIFFFTPENPDVPVVYRGDYIVSGVPMNIRTQPILTRVVR